MIDLDFSNTFGRCRNCNQQVSFPHMCYSNPDRPISEVVVKLGTDCLSCGKFVPVNDWHSCLVISLGYNTGA